MTTLSRRQMLRELQRARKAGEWLLPPGASERPQTRGECAGGPRPCPLVGCRYHLYLDVEPVNGSIKLNQPDLQVWDMERSCALDEAEKNDGMMLEEIGDIFGVTRERVRQIETSALLHLMKLVGDDPEAPETDIRAAFARNQPLQANHVLQALGLEEENSWLKNLLSSHLSTNLDEEPWLTLMTDSG